MPILIFNMAEREHWNNSVDNFFPLLSRSDLFQLACLYFFVPRTRGDFDFSLMVKASSENEDRVDG